MRLKVALPLLAVLAAAALAGSARASHCGACCYPVQCCSPEQCCLPTIQYRVCYHTVYEDRTCICYRPVYRTVMRECRTQCCRPVYEQHVRQHCYTVCRPVYEDYNVVRKYTVCRPVYEQHVRKCCYTTYKQCWQEYQVPQHYCTYHPVYQQHVRKCCYTVYKPVVQEYQVPQHYCTYHPVYQQHVRKCCYTVYKPCWQEYQVPQHYCTYHPVYQQHVRKCCYTVYKPVCAGISGAATLLHLSSGVSAARAQVLLHGRTSRAGRSIRCRSTTAPITPSTSITCAKCCYTVYKPVVQEYQVPQHYCTYHPVYQQHVRKCCYTTYKPCVQEYQVPQSLLHLSAGLSAARLPGARDVLSHGDREAAADATSRSYTCEPVWTRTAHHGLTRAAGTIEQRLLPRSRSSRSAARRPAPGPSIPAPARRTIARVLWSAIRAVPRPLGLQPRLGASAGSAARSAAAITCCASTATPSITPSASRCPTP